MVGGISSWSLVILMQGDDAMGWLGGLWDFWLVAGDFDAL